MSDYTGQINGCDLIGHVGCVICACLRVFDICKFWCTFLCIGADFNAAAQCLHLEEGSYPHPVTFEVCENFKQHMQHLFIPFSFSHCVWFE